MGMNKLQTGHQSKSLKLEEGGGGGHQSRKGEIRLPIYVTWKS